MEGVVVSAQKAGGTITVSVVTDQQGRYRFPRTRLEPARPLHDPKRGEGRAQQGQRVVALVKAEHDVHWCIDDDLPHEGGHTA